MKLLSSLGALSSALALVMLVAFSAVALPETRVGGTKGNDWGSPSYPNWNLPHDCPTHKQRGALFGTTTGAGEERIWGYEGCDLIASGKGNDTVYGGKGVINGPVYYSYVIDGHSVIVNFSQSGKGLAFKNGTQLQGFQIAGEVDAPVAARRTRLSGSISTSAPLSSEARAWASLPVKTSSSLSTARSGSPRNQESSLFMSAPADTW